MIIYSSTKQSFIQDFEQGILVKKLHQTLTEKYRRVGESEIHSWQTSLSYMANVMRDFCYTGLSWSCYRIYCAKYAKTGGLYYYRFRSTR